MLTSKDACPKCKTKFRVGALPTHDEMKRLAKIGIINLGEPAPESITCPKCSTALRIVSVRMGNFFSAAE